MSISPLPRHTRTIRPQLRLVPTPDPQDRPIGSTPGVPDRVDVFLDMGYVIRSARTTFGWRVGSRTPDPLATAREILASRHRSSELGTVHVFDGLHDPDRRPLDHHRMLAWKHQVEASGEVIVHLRPLQYLPDGGFRQKEVDTSLAFAMDDAARSGRAEAIVAFTGDRDLLPAARRVIAADVRFESACWGQRGGIFLPEERTWTHRLGRAAYQRCTATGEFGDAA